MRGKEGSDTAPGPPRQFFRNGPRQSQTVERARAASDFVKDDEAALGGLTQDARGFHHFHHERTLALRQIVRSAHAGEDAIAQAKLRFPGRDKRAHLREEADQRGLAEHGRLTGHVGAGDQQEPSVLIHVEIVGHESGFPDDALDDRVTAFPDGDGLPGMERGARPVVAHRRFRQRLPVVQLRQHVGHEQDAGAGFRQCPAKLLEQLVLKRFAPVGGGKQFFFQFLEADGREAFSFLLKVFFKHLYPLLNVIINKS